MQVLWPQYFMAEKKIPPHDWMPIFIMIQAICLKFYFKTVQQEVWSNA